jgi:hypothetical protein
MVVTLPFGMMCADVEVSEVLPSCEYVDVDDTDALDGGIVARAFFGLGGVDLCVDMSFCNGREVLRTVQRRIVQRRQVSQLGQRPLGGVYRRNLRTARDVQGDLQPGGGQEGIKKSVPEEYL